MTSGVSPDSYHATAGAYDLLSEPFRQEQLAALRHMAPHLAPGHGPILDVGCGSGVHTAWVLDAAPDAQVLGLEPSPAMRALALSRLSATPAWRSRVTVRPQGVLDAPLPDRLGGVIMLGVIGHFNPLERSRVLQRLARRLPDGGVILLDLQLPEEPVRVPAYEFATNHLGDLSYRGIAEAWPVDGERMRWRMTYQTVEDDAVLHEQSIEHTYHHPMHHEVEAQARACGLALERLGDGTLWTATRTSF